MSQTKKSRMRPIQGMVNVIFPTEEERRQAREKWLQLLKLYLEIASLAVFILGIPVGLIKYFDTVKKEQRDRAYGTYDALDNKYIEYQKLCFDHPDLDVFDIAINNPASQTPEVARQEIIAYTMLFSIFERALLMYKDAVEDTEEYKQKLLWEKYIRSYCGRENFREAWKKSGSGAYAADFEKFMKQELLKAAQAKSR